MTTLTPTSFLRKLQCLFLAVGLGGPVLKAQKFDQALLGASYVPPLQMANWPLKIGPEAQLFLDDYLIHSMPGVARIPHQPRKYEGNPILVGDKPWETSSGIHANGSIVYDPDARQYRMYYDGAHLVAYSKDGVQWTKPSLGIISYKGSTDNNIVMGYDNPTDLGSFIHDPRDPDPGKRWKASVFHYDRGENPRWAKNGGQYGERAGLYAFFSADGLRWSKEAILMIPGRQGRLAGSTWPLTGVDDVSLVTWDNRMGKFVAWLKIWDLTDGRYYRARAMALSDDFVHWSQPWTAMLPDRLDPPDLQLYGMVGWPYESMWVGTVRAFHSATGSKQVDFQLISSRDGIHWARANNRAAFIPNGPDGAYDHGYHNDFTTGPIRFGDELYFYYASTAVGKERVPTDVKTGICLAKLRVDGFASLRVSSLGSVEAPAVITRPLQLTGRELFVNAMTSKGTIRVEVLNGNQTGDLQPIEGFSLQEAVELKGDGIAQRVTWKNRQNLSSLAGKQIRLKFHLNGLAALYSFSVR